MKTSNSDILHQIIQNLYSLREPGLTQSPAPNLNWDGNTHYPFFTWELPEDTYQKTFPIDPLVAFVIIDRAITFNLEAHERIKLYCCPDNRVLQFENPNYQYEEGEELEPELYHEGPPCLFVGWD